MVQAYSGYPCTRHSNLLLKKLDGTERRQVDDKRDGGPLQPENTSASQS